MEFAAVVFDELLNATGLEDVRMGAYEVNANGLLRFEDLRTHLWFDTEIHMNEYAPGQWMSDQYLEGRIEYMEENKE